MNKIDEGEVNLNGANLSFIHINYTLTSLYIKQKIFSVSKQTIKLHDIHTGDCLKTFLGHSNWVRRVKLLNENQIVTCSQDKTIKIWDIISGNCIKTLFGHSDAVWDILILTNDRIASCSIDQTIRIWNVESGECINSLNGHKGAV